MYVCCLCFVFFPPLKSMLISWFRFVWLLTMSWLNASKSYTNWTIKELLNGENVFLSFLPVKVDQTQRNLSSGEARSREQKHSGVIIRAKSQLFVFSLSALERELTFCSCWYVKNVVFRPNQGATFDQIWILRHWSQNCGSFSLWAWAAAMDISTATSPTGFVLYNFEVSRFYFYLCLCYRYTRDKSGWRPQHNQ